MIIPIFLPHLGCGDRCIYCDQTYITDIRNDDIEAVIKEYLGPFRGKAEIGLYGGNIFGLEPVALKRLFSFFEPFRDRITNFRISTKPVPLRDDTIRVLKENGVDNIELGIPDFNDRILGILNRRHTAEDLAKAFVRLKEEGFTVALQVMVGLPQETMADVADTADSLIRLAPDYVRIYPLVVLMGTPLEKMHREGSFVPIPFEDAVTRALYIYLRCLKKGVKVVKMGLTENEVIKERVVAGHYHPAFGYVVKTWAFRLALLAKIRDMGIKGNAVVTVNKTDVPHLLGDKRSNMDRFLEEGVSIDWEAAEREVGSFRVTHGALTEEGDIFDALTMIPL
jgi:histone acetyltransferase (RNA polymerase elongator complex component)